MEALNIPVRRFPHKKHNPLAASLPLFTWQELPIRIDPVIILTPVTAIDKLAIFHSGEFIRSEAQFVVPFERPAQEAEKNGGFGVCAGIEEDGESDQPHQSNCASCFIAMSTFHTQRITPRATRNIAPFNFYSYLIPTCPHLYLIQPFPLLLSSIFFLLRSPSCTFSPHLISSLTCISFFWSE